MPDVTYFEVPADDIARARKFYSDLFGWEIEKMNHGMEYYSIQTGGEDALSGGLMKRQQPRQVITLYLDVSSIDECTPRIVQAGGQVHVPKTAVAGMGWFAICLDTENNAFGIWETDENAK